MIRTQLLIVTVLLIAISGCDRPSADLPPCQPPSEKPTVKDIIITQQAETEILFSAAISSISPQRLELMKRYTIKPDGPVEVSDLRAVSVSYWGFDSRVHNDGLLIVHKEIAVEVMEIFGELFDAQFPIENIRPASDYQGVDDLSMQANNTSAFNCRYVTGRVDKFSVHSFGWAIDINPIENPYHKGNIVLPAAGANYIDRSVNRKGMITPDGPVVRAFEKRGWTWGGRWRTLKDYQHFEKKN